MYNPMLNELNQNKGNNPLSIFNFLMNTNPQFRDFVEKNKNKSPEQIAQENGIDINEIYKFKK